MKNITFFASNIALIRKVSGLSVDEFANLFSLNRDNINSYTRKNKPSKPSVEFMIKLQSLLNYQFTIEELWYQEIDAGKIPKKDNWNKGKTTKKPEKKEFNLEIDISDKKHFDSHENIVKELYRLGEEVEMLKTVIRNRDAKK